MKLNDYIKTDRFAARKLAATINAHTPDVYRWASGKRPTPHKYGAEIEKATNGLVTRQDMFPDEWQSIWPELMSAA